MQFQADLLQRTIERPSLVETTALGAAHLAGLAVGYWDSVNDFEMDEPASVFFEPHMSKEEADRRYAKWQRAVEAARLFTKHV